MKTRKTKYFSKSLLSFVITSSIFVVLALCLVSLYYKKANLQEEVHRYQAQVASKDADIELILELLKTCSVWYVVDAQHVCSQPDRKGSSIVLNGDTLLPITDKNLGVMYPDFNAKMYFLPAKVGNRNTVAHGRLTYRYDYQK